MSFAGIRVGLVHEQTEQVTEERTARHVGSGDLRVFATPAMVSLIERASVALLAPHLPEGFSTVGIAISVRHLAPTPLGKDVRVRVEVKAVDGGQLRLAAEVWDDIEKVGEAEHQRAVIEVARFLRRVENKRG
jgi:fluoroacetyl-CoA thioesterase